MLSNATNNINQIVKTTNTSGIIYKKDIDYIREKNRKIIKRNMEDKFHFIKQN